MIKQTAIAATLALFAAASPANADVKFGVYINPGFGYYSPGPVYVQPDYAPVIDQYSCREGRRMVRRSGFRRVRAIECNGRYYTYRAREYGDRLRVRLDSYSGEIVSVRYY